MLPDGYWKQGFNPYSVKVIHIAFMGLNGQPLRTTMAVPDGGFKDGDIIDLIPLQQKLHEDGNVSS